MTHGDASIAGDSEAPADDRLKRPGLPIVCIMGPTGAGKTSLAEALHQRGGFELISVDSAQVYRGMDIGTAKPSAAELKITPHHLINIRDPWEGYSAAEFVTEAAAVIEQVSKRQHTPVLVGGTMLYFRALLEGLSELPEADPQVRATLEQQAAVQGWTAMHQRLQEVDPQAAGRIHPNDPQRICRALEVFEVTGQTISALQASRRRAFPGHFLKLAVNPVDRAVLHARINRRFEHMLEDGLVDEVRRLRADHRLNPQLPAMRAVGYRQVWQYLDGDFGLDELQQRAAAATRQLAKRQLTWLRSVDGLCWHDPTQNQWHEAAIRQIARFLHKAV